MSQLPNILLWHNGSPNSPSSPFGRGALLSSYPAEIDSVYINIGKYPSTMPNECHGKLIISSHANSLYLINSVADSFVVHFIFLSKSRIISLLHSWVVCSVATLISSSRTSISVVSPVPEYQNPANVAVLRCCHIAVVSSITKVTYWINSLINSIVFVKG